MHQGGLKAVHGEKSASWLGNFMSGFRPYAKPLGSALAKRIYTFVAAGGLTTLGIFSLGPAQATKNVERFSL